MKKFAFLFSILALVLLMPIKVEAETSGKAGENVTWEIVDDTLIISGSGKMMDYQFQMKPYTGNTGAPWHDIKVSKVIINEGVESIGAYAFADQRSLTSIEIPESVTNIGGAAFDHCVGLTGINLPSSLKTVHLENCESLKSVDLPESVTSFSLSGCSSLTSVKIPENVTSFSLRGCSSLTSIKIPESVTSIGADAFYDCTSLISVEIPDSVTSIGESAFKCCYKLKNITIPDGVISIGKSAFDGSGLKNIRIPDGVTSIGEYAFASCDISSVTIPRSVTKIGAWTFSACNGLTLVDIPEGVKNIESNTFFDCLNLKTIIIPASVEYIAPQSIGYYPNWDIRQTVPVEGLVIYGYIGSEAEKYAINNGFIFNPIPQVTKASDFTDVTAGKWYESGVQYVFEKGIMSGYTDPKTKLPTGLFGTNDSLTREQFATMMYRMAGEPAITFTGKFADVPAGKYYANAVEWCAANGIVTGYQDGSNKFGVGDNIKRQDIAVILHRYESEFLKKDVSAKADYDAMHITDKTQVSTYADNAMQWCVGVGILTGKDQKNGTYLLDPKGDATRAEVATMIMRYMTR